MNKYFNVELFIVHTTSATTSIKFYHLLPVVGFLELLAEINSIDSVIDSA